MAKPKAEVIKRPIERMGGNLKQSAWSAVFESLATLILGVLFVLWPEAMMQAIAYIVGVILLVKGCFNLFTYFMDKKNVYSNLLLSGLVSTLLGLAAIIAGPNIANVFRIIIAIFLIYESLVKLNSAVKLYAAKIGLWKIVAILALVIFVLGLFVAVNDTAAIIGWAMIISGVVGIISDIMFIMEVDKVMAFLTSGIDKVAEITTPKKKK